MKDPLRPMSKEFVRGRVETNHREVINGSHVSCTCEWFSDSVDLETGRERHQAHQDDMVERLMT